MKRKDTIYVTRPDLPPLDEYVQEISSLWDSHILTNMGEKHRTFNEQIAMYLKAENVALFSHGHEALEMILQAMDLKGEVITTPFSFASTTHAIVRNGLKPVFGDISAENFTLDANRIEELITPRTCAILPVHVYGQLCDVDKIEQIARKHHLKVIYDAAHAFGVEKNGVGAGNFGDASMFSFHATKVFHTIEGGAVTYKDPELGEILAYLKNFGIKDENTVLHVGANAKMNEFQAAMGICNLRHIDEHIVKRKAIYELYVSRLGENKEIQVLRYDSDIRPNYAYFPILIKSDRVTRDEMYGYLREHGIICRKYFYPLISDYECYRGRYNHGDTPVADRVANQVMTLPIYAELSLEKAEEICDLISERLHDRAGIKGN